MSEIVNEKGKMNDAIESMLLERLQHIKERMAWSKPSSGLSVYRRGFFCGKLHRLIAERYFLELLMEELNS